MGGIFRVTRRYRFSASHRLHCLEFSDAENREVYGKCNHPYGHGHDYVLEVSARGPADPGTGQAVDVRKLDRLVRRAVLDDFDHRNLNVEIPVFSKIVPTTENVALEISRRLSEGWAAEFPAGPALEKVRVHETKNNTVETFR